MENTSSTLPLDMPADRQAEKAALTAWGILRVILRRVWREICLMTPMVFNLLRFGELLGIVCIAIAFGALSLMFWSWSIQTPWLSSLLSGVCLCGGAALIFALVAALPGFVLFSAGRRVLWRPYRAVRRVNAWRNPGSQAGRIS